MAKGLVKDSTLTAIANAIREKTETTATMLPSEMAALIQGINGAKFAWGAKTISSSATTSTTITHDLGQTPNFILFALAGSTQYSSKQISMVLKPDGGGITCYQTSNTANVQYSNYVANFASSHFPTIDSSTFSVKADYYLGSQYYWVAGVVE